VIEISLGKSHDQGKVRPFDETFFLQAFEESGDSLLGELGVLLSRREQEPYHRQIRFGLGASHSRKSKRDRGGRPMNFFAA
jgi:hypothetical protein